ncbi:UDP-glucose-4-epimerase [Orbilia oligospora]|nr:UDP-glucose-4-epimerase [Orbilia oligospora]
MAAPKETVLITGGTGYIGSFTSLELLVAGYNVVIVDNLYNSSEETVNRIELICGIRPAFHKVDVTDAEALEMVFKSHPEISSVIHFAALKSVGESTEIPAEYYRINVGGTAQLLSVMKKYNVNKIVFSSSATVYGDATKYPDMIPIPETCPLGPTNPYGRTKWFNEMIIEDHVKANPGSAAALLRYFNPCGAHPSGILGEDPQGVPYNLLPLLGQVAVGKRPKIQVYGTDYDSHDGTAIRDYIHVVDLAQGHIAALEKLYDPSFKCCKAWNLGSGRGSTVFDILRAFSKAVGRELPYELAPRRGGDVLDLTAKPDLARKELNWYTKKTLEEACEDLWRWVKNNPSGYREEYKQGLLDEWKAKTTV